MMDAEYELLERHGFYKAALATVFCLASFYLYDLYDFIVMHDRRELVLRLVQALGLAWVALAIAFYAVPRLMIGRSVSLIALPLALTLMVGWRLTIHWLLGHPQLGERILIVGSGEMAIDVAREPIARPQRQHGRRIGENRRCRDKREHRQGAGFDTRHEAILFTASVLNCEIHAAQ